MERPTFSQSLETQLLVKALADDKHSDLFTWDELSKIAGVDARRSPAVRSARNAIQRDKGTVFVTIRGVGIKRAADTEVVDAGASDMARIRNTARKGIKRLGCVKDFVSLPSDKRTAFNVTASALGMIHHATTPSAQKKIESKVEKTQQKLPVAETLAALGIS